MSNPPGSPRISACPEAEESEIAPSSRSAPVATMKLLTGPATEVRMSSIIGWRKFRGSTGVGLAQPSKWDAADSRDQRQDDRAKQIDVANRIQRDPSQHARRGIAAA